MQQETKSVLTLASSEVNNVIYPVVAVLINDVKYRAFLESGAGSSYISSTIANLLRKPPVRKETKRIEMMVNLTLRNIEIYEATIKDLLRNFAWNFQK